MYRMIKASVWRYGDGTRYAQKDLGWGLVQVDEPDEEGEFFVQLEYDDGVGYESWCEDTLSLGYTPELHFEDELDDETYDSRIKQVESAIIELLGELGLVLGSI